MGGNWNWNDCTEMGESGNVKSRSRSSPETTKITLNLLCGERLQSCQAKKWYKSGWKMFVRS